MPKNIPKDLKRWLKDNGYYKDFSRLINECGYMPEDLSYKSWGFYNGKEYYGIIDWFNIPIQNRYIMVFRNGRQRESMKYTDLLDKIGIKWQ